MERLLVVMSVLLMLQGSLTAQTMNIHIGSTIHQYDLATVDSITFSEVTGDSLPGFVYIPGGTFTMGQNGTNGSPEHEVTLTRDFYLYAHEVTNKEFLAALQWAYENELLEVVTSSTVRAHGQELIDLDGGTWGICQIIWNGDEFVLAPVRQGTYEDQGSGNHPVMDVTWYGAACYCDWLSILNGIEPFYNGDWSVSEEHNPYTATSYRLPTEAEWEYAARYPDGRVYPWGFEQPDPCTQPNFWNCVDWTSPVGSFPGGNSALGLQDMAGNVWEWVNDFTGDYSNSPQIDPLGPVSGMRQCRCGSWNDVFNSRVLAAFRYPRDASYSSVGIGFRVALTLPQ